VDAQMERYRYFLKDSVRMTIDFALTDQSRGVKPPPLEKPFPADAIRIDLTRKEDLEGTFTVDLFRAIAGRQSH